MQGWIKLHRQLLQHDLWNEKPFSRGQAWIDLLLLANHESKKVLFDGSMIQVERGQHITSIRKLCDRWGWSNTKIVKFLKMLSECQMLIYKSDTKKTLVTIVNYSVYQDSNDAETTQKRRKNDTETTQKHTNKNDKECKEIIGDFEKIIFAYTDSPDLIQAIKDFIEHRKSIKKPIKTSRTLELILKELNKHTNKVAVLEQSIVNGWQGIFDVAKKEKQKEEYKNPYRFC